MNFYYFAFVLMSLVTPVFAQGGTKPGGFGFGSFLPMMLVMFFIIYFFMIRPEQRKQKEKKNLLGNIKKGDKVITIGGIHGTVDKVKSDEGQIVIKVDDNTKLTMSVRSVQAVVPKKSQQGN